MKNISSKGNFNNSGKKPKVTKNVRNYSHKEVVIKSDRYASVAKTGKQQKDMQEIKDQYFKRSLEKQVNRGERDRNLRMGIDAHIHRRDVLERQEKQDKVIDQSDRNKTMKKAKEYYQRNYSTTKAFKEVNKKPKVKSKGMDKG